MPDTAIHEDAGESLVYFPEDLPPLLGLALPSVYRYLRLGKIPARKIGSRYVIGRAAFEKWLAGDDSVGRSA
jgi:excisionase family DNA binding protein